VKFVVHDLQIGQVIQGKVTEILSEDEVIMSFAGDLLRVQNHSLGSFAAGQMLNCLVTSVDPLRFKLLKIDFTSLVTSHKFL